jgi:hypothetical protein
MVDVIWNNGTASGNFCWTTGVIFPTQTSRKEGVFAPQLFPSVGIAWLWFVRLLAPSVGFHEWQCIPFRE